MKRLITLLRLNLIFQGMIVLLLAVWPILDGSPLKKDLAAAGFLLGVMLLFYFLSLVCLYRLERGASLLYIFFTGMIVIAPLTRERVCSSPASLELALCASFSFVIALIFFSPLRHRLGPLASSTSPRPHWIIWPVGVAIALLLILGVDRDLRNGKAKNKKAAERRKLEEVQNAIP